MRFNQEKDGEPFFIKTNGWKIKCCDCGLVHTLYFRVIRCGKGYRLRVVAYRQNKSRPMNRRRPRPSKAALKPKSNKRGGSRPALLAARAKGGRNESVP